MSKDIWGVIRTTGLVVMIVCAVIADAILFWQGQLWWAYFWLWIILSVAVFEAASYIAGKKTISTRWKEWAEKSPTMAYLTLLILATGLLGLWIHLAVWGGMFNG